MLALEVKNLSKKFGSFTAVDNISFSLKEGEILGFLGRNGAGKTTTIQMLLSVLSPTSGKINYFGKDLIKYRSEVLELINFSSTYTHLPLDLTVKESLTFASYLYEISDRKKRLSEIIEIFRLQDLLKLQGNSLSAGQTTRVNIAKALLNSPKVLLLDEPTASLDPEVAEYIREFLLEQRKKESISIILTSHNMGEVEDLCDRVIFIDQGKIIANDTPDVLAKSIENCHVELLTSKAVQKQLVEIIVKKNYIYQVKGNAISIDVREKELAGFLQELTQYGIVYEGISIDKPTLEDYFLEHARL